MSDLEPSLVPKWWAVRPAHQRAALLIAGVVFVMATVPLSYAILDRNTYFLEPWPWNFALAGLAICGIFAVFGFAPIRSPNTSECVETGLNDAAVDSDAVENARRRRDGMRPEPHNDPATRRGMEQERTRTAVGAHLVALNGAKWECEKCGRPARKVSDYIDLPCVAD